MKRTAFTLIELLMVITILGLLIGMLLPSLNRALEFPRRATCLNNLKQMGMAMFSYQAANNGYMPPFCSAGTNRYDWIWVDSLAPYISGQPPGPGVESGVHLPNKSIWACPDAQPNTFKDVVTAYQTQYPNGGFRTNYANTCGNILNGTWQPARNNAGLIMTDGQHQTASPDSYRICNRYVQMDPRSVLLFCGCYGCAEDPGFPDPATVPDDWNQNSPGPRQPGKGVILIPFAHLNQNPALTMNGSVKSYSKGTQMGGSPSDPDTRGDDTWVPLGN